MVTSRLKNYVGNDWLKCLFARGVPIAPTDTKDENFNFHWDNTFVFNEMMG